MDISGLNWATLRRTEGDSVAIDFMGHPKHIALIPFEVLEDGLTTVNEDPLESAEVNKRKVIAAIERALGENVWQELVRIGTSEKLLRLWINRSHFGK